jgi:hypothetical protein
VPMFRMLYGGGVVLALIALSLSTGVLPRPASRCPVANSGNREFDQASIGVEALPASTSSRWSCSCRQGSEVCSRGAC